MPTKALGLLIKVPEDIKRIVSVPLCALMNISFVLGIFLNTCKIVPNLEDESGLHCNNIIQVSLLSNIGKIIEEFKHIKSIPNVPQSRVPGSLLSFIFMYDFQAFVALSREVSNIYGDMH